MTLRPVHRLLAVVLILLLTALFPAAPLYSHIARAQRPARVPSDACNASLALTLKPGAHFPGAYTLQLPGDMPPGPIILKVPVYPGATPTTEQEPHPSFGVPAVLYLMSASTVYRSDADIGAISRWYQDAFPRCGFSYGGSGTSGQNGVELSSEIDFRRQEGRNQIQVYLSFERSSSGGTLILYVALAITPPVYPVPGSPLRIPGDPVSFEITKYSADNGTKPLRPIRTATVTDQATAASLADEINHLPKPIVQFESCPEDDGSHDTLVFTDADRSTHVVRVGLRGCRDISVPPPAPGANADDTLLAHLDAVLKSSAAPVPYPFDARSLKPRSMRQLGGSPGRFLGAPPSDTPLLYLSYGALYTVSSARETPRLVAHGVEDAAFTARASHVLVRPAGADLAHLRLIDLTTGGSATFALPRTAVLLGSNAGIRPARLSDALGPLSQYVWMRLGRKIGGIDPEHPAGDTYWSPNFLPAASSLGLIAVSPQGMHLAVFNRRRGLSIRITGNAQGRIGPVQRTLPVKNVRFLSWAPDDTHLAYDAGGELYVLDIGTGDEHRVLRLGNDVIHAAAWDPWSRVIALSVGARGAPATDSRTLLVNADGTGTGTLPIRGATSLYWSPGHGTTLGVTRATGKGSQAWAVSLSSLPPDPASDLPPP